MSSICLWRLGSTYIDTDMDMEHGILKNWGNQHNNDSGKKYKCKYIYCSIINIIIYYKYPKIKHWQCMASISSFLYKGQVSSTTMDLYPSPCTPRDKKNVMMTTSCGLETKKCYVDNKLWIRDKKKMLWWRQVMN